MTCPRRSPGRAVVLLGEQHDQAEHHRWQLHTIAALHGCGRTWWSASRCFRAVSSRCSIAGRRGHLGEEEFLAEVDWSQVWGMDAALYLPLFHFTRMHRLPHAGAQCRSGDQPADR